MRYTPGPWTWRHPFQGDPEIWVEGEQNGDTVTVAILEENETDARIICSASKMYECLCEALYYVDCAAGEDAADLARKIRRVLSCR